MRHLRSSRQGYPETIGIVLEAVIGCELSHTGIRKFGVPDDASLTAAEATAELVLPGRGTAYDPALAAAEGRVPKQFALGEGGTLAIRAIHRDNVSRPARVIALAELKQSILQKVFSGDLPLQSKAIEEAAK